MICYAQYILFQKTCYQTLVVSFIVIHFVVAGKCKLFTHFRLMFHFYIPWKRLKTNGFLAFTESIDMEHWAKIDLKNGENLPEMNNPRFPGTNTNTFPSTQKMQISSLYRCKTNTKQLQIELLYCFSLNYVTLIWTYIAHCLFRLKRIELETFRSRL